MVNTVATAVRKFESTDMMLPVASLSHDVPVDREHVDKLKQSLQASGQLAAILVWAEGNQIIDGFHRLTALKELGVENALCTVIDCTEEEYLDSRVVSAVMHEGVVFPRAVRWMREVWARTQWGGKITLQQAFTWAAERGRRAGAGRNVSKWHGLDAAELDAIVDWALAKADMWGVTPATAYSWFSDIDGAAPHLIDRVRPHKSVGWGKPRTQILTRSVLHEIASRAPDYITQEALVDKAVAERLDKFQVADLARAMQNATPGERATLLTTNWMAHRAEKQKPDVVNNYSTKKRGSAEQYIATTVSILKDAEGRLDGLKAMKEMPIDENGEVIRSILSLQLSIARFLGVETDTIAALQGSIKGLRGRNKELRAEIVELRRQVDAANRVLNLGKKIYADSVG